MADITQSADIEFNVDSEDASREIKKLGKDVDSFDDKVSKSSKNIKKGKEAATQATKKNAKETENALRRVEKAEKRAELAGLKGAARTKAQGVQFRATARAAGVLEKDLKRVDAAFGKMAAAQSKTSRSSSQFSRNMVGLAARIGLVAIAGAGLAKVLNELAIGSTLVSARNETLGVALAVVARNTGQNIGLIGKLEVKIQRMGLTLEASRTILARFSATRLPIARIEELVDLGRNLAVVMGTNTSEAVVRLTRAITNQEVEILRTAGLNIKFETGHKKLAASIGKTADSLTDAEKRLANFNIVMEQGANFLGTYEAALGTTGKQLTSLPRLIENFKQAIGVELQPVLDTAVQSLTSYLKVQTAILEGKAIDRSTFARLEARLAKDNIEITGRGIPGLLRRSQQGFPLTEILTDPILKGFGLDLAGDISEAIERSSKQSSPFGIFTAPNFRDRKGKVTFDSLFKVAAGETLTPVNQQILIDFFKGQEKDQFASFRGVAGKDFKTLLPPSVVEGFELFGTPLKIPTSGVLSGGTGKKIGSVGAGASRQDVVALLEKQEKTRKANAALALKAATLLVAEEKKLLDTVGRIKFQRQENLKTLGKTAQAVRDINLAANLETTGFLRSERDKARKGLKTETILSLSGVENQTALFQKQLDLEETKGRLGEETLLRQLARKESQLEQEKALELASIQFVSRSDLAGKLSTEQRKFEIEVEFVKRSIDLQKRRIEAEAGFAIARQPELQDQLEVRQKADLDRLSEQQADTVLLARKTLINRQSEAIIRENERVFNRLKRGAEDVFDSLLRSSQGFFENLTNIFKTAILTGIREVVSTQIASALAPVFGGSNQSRGGGLFGGLRLPGFGNRSPSSRGIGPSAALAAVIPGFGGGFPFPGAPGGTTGFNGPVGGVGRGGFGSVSSGVGTAAQLGRFSQLRDLFGLGSSISTGAGSATTFGAASLGQKLASFAGSTGGIAAGIGIGALGVRKGGASGAALAAGGGALAGFGIGAKIGAIGGPLGIAIGAGIGVAATLIRGLFDGAKDQAKKQIKSAFGLEVNDKGILSQIVSVAKNQFGGNIGVAIRSPAILDLLELFAASTGQDFGQVGIKNLRFVARQSGGQIQQEAQFRFGRPFASVSSLPVHNPTAQNVTILQLNAEATRNVLQGQAVEAIRTNPREVQAASINSQQANFGRRQQAALGLQPNTVLT